MFDKETIKKNFSRGAKNYNEAASIQAKAASELVKLATDLSPFLNKNSDRKKIKILDLGSGTSFVSKSLIKKLEANDSEITTIFELDISPEMLNSWHERPSNIFPIQGDIENLSFEKNSFDLILSSFALHWISDFEKIFSQIFSLLKPHGIFAFCLPTKQSLRELKAAKTFQISDFPCDKNLKLALERSGFREKKFEKVIVKQNFKNGVEALKLLKKIGANYSKNSSKNRNFLGKNALTHFNKFCLKNFGDEHKNFATSWEISYFISSKNDRQNP